MLNIKRCGYDIEINRIPNSITPIIFKNIADESGASKCLVTYTKGSEYYEILIQYKGESAAVESEKCLALLDVFFQISEKQLLTSWLMEELFREELLSQNESRKMQETIVAAMRKASREMEEQKVNGFFESFYIVWCGGFIGRH